MKIYMTKGTCPLLLDRKSVTEINGIWYWLDFDVWRKMTSKPDIDPDMSARWWGTR